MYDETSKTFANATAAAAVYVHRLRMRKEEKIFCQGG